MSITEQELDSFITLLECNELKGFFQLDIGCRLADKYLIAMVCIYFKRANISLEEYTIFHFYSALHLAHDLEEEEEELKYEIHVWALGSLWHKHYQKLLRGRDSLWFRMNCQGVVNLNTCEEVSVTTTRWMVQELIRLCLMPGS
ncbi:unnamed protein product [Timema podura]|uniref:Speedy protein C n=1 Tax=Timema podura TaxID=61482 RepID=A0ABN7NV76_TIMPD|nr:unnamed protein product [Timema podura]